MMVQTKRGKGYCGIHSQKKIAANYGEGTKDLNEYEIRTVITYHNPEELSFLSIKNAAKVQRL